MRFGSKLSGLLKVCRKVGSPRTAARQNAAAAAVPAHVEPLEGRTLMAAQPIIGTNLDQITYYSPAWTFTDAFKQSMPWSASPVDLTTGRVGSWGQGGAVSVDAKGWPTELKTWTGNDGHQYRQRLDTLIFRDIGGKFPTGRYHVAWDGKGTVGLGNGARVVSSTANSLEVDISSTGQSGIHLFVDAIDRSDPVRDIHVWMPDHNGQTFAGQEWSPGASFSPFHPEFINKLRPFKTIRFMDWGRTNGSTLEHWDQRRTFDAATQGSEGADKRGVAYEYWPALVNELDADAWVNIPHSADDEFVRNLATLFRDQLEPGRRVYLEWGNEIWNTAGGFTTYNWLDERARASGKEPFQVAGENIRHDFDIWSDVFAGQIDRITRVVAGQAGNGYVLEELMKNVDGRVDAVAVAGYIQSNNRASYNRQTTAEQVAQDVLDSIPGTIGGLARAKAVGDAYSAKLGRQIKLVTYEGGQHLDGQNAPFQQAFYGAQVHRLMYRAYKELLQGFRDLGGHAFTHFTFVSQNSPYGSWGSLQYQNQPAGEAPKYQALVDASNGSLYRTEFKIESVQPKAWERGRLGASFKVTRLGLTEDPVDVILAYGGSASAGDYNSLPSVLSFAAGETSKVIEVTPVDDAEVEATETLEVALASNDAHYDRNPRFSTTRIDIADDDGYRFESVRVTNGSFESGNLDGWRLEGRSSVGVPDRRVDNAPASPRDGSRYAWSAGRNGGGRFGDKVFNLVQRLDLTDFQSKVDDGGARLTLVGWGAGGGAGLDSAAVEVRFFTRKGDGSGEQLGDASASKRVYGEGTWTAMVVDAEVPRGARGAEVRLVGDRRGGDTMMTVGFDDVKAALRLPAGREPEQVPPPPPVTPPVVPPSETPPPVVNNPPAVAEEPPYIPPPQVHSEPAGPMPETPADIGSPSLPGMVNTVSPGTAYDVTGGGMDVFGKSDQFHFAYGERNGNFDVKVRVASLTNAEGSDGMSMAGLMVRRSLDADSANVFAKVKADDGKKGFRLSSRKADGAKTKAAGKGVTDFAAGAWLRLARKGNTFTAYRSADGVKWKKLGSAKIKMDRTVYLGFAVASHSASSTATAQFRDFGDYVPPSKRSRRT